MSIDCMNRVWKQSKQKGAQLFLLIAIADCADEYSYAWPSAKNLAQKIRMNERHIRRMIDKLVTSKEIILFEREGKSSPIVVTLGLTKEQIKETIEKRGLYKLRQVTPVKMSGVKMSARINTPCQNVRTDKMSADISDNLSVKEKESTKEKENNLFMNRQEDPIHVEQPSASTPSALDSPASFASDIETPQTNGNGAGHNLSDAAKCNPEDRPKAPADWKIKSAYWPIIVRAFRYWREVMQRPRTILGSKGAKKIQDRLEEGFTEEQIIRAIDGCLKSDWHMGRDPKTNKQKYNALIQIFRDDDQIISMMDRTEPTVYKEPAYSKDPTMVEFEKRLAEREQNEKSRLIH